jgi:hypothetical protein
VYQAIITTNKLREQQNPLIRGQRAAKSPDSWAKSSKIKKIRGQRAAKLRRYVVKEQQNPLIRGQRFEFPDTLLRGYRNTRKVGRLTTNLLDYANL